LRRRLDSAGVVGLGLGQPRDVDERVEWVAVVADSVAHPFARPVPHALACPAEGLDERVGDRVRDGE
jgi:hypothetical protein